MKLNTGQHTSIVNMRAPYVSVASLFGYSKRTEGGCVSLGSYSVLLGSLGQLKSGKTRHETENKDRNASTHALCTTS